MSKYVPIRNDFFYVSIPARSKDVEQMDGTVTTIVTEDRSYREDIFQAISFDDTHMLAKRVYGGWMNDKPHLFRKSDYVFSPVGPFILDSLGLKVLGDEAN